MSGRELGDLEPVRACHHYRPGWRYRRVAALRSAAAHRSRGVWARWKRVMEHRSSGGARLIPLAKSSFPGVLLGFQTGADGVGGWCVARGLAYVRVSNSGRPGRELARVNPVRISAGQVSRASRLRRCMYVGCNHTNQCNAGRPPGPVWVSQTTDSQGPLACGVVTITPCTVTDPVAACSRRIPFPLRYDELRAYGEHRYSERQSHAGDRGENPLTPTTHICVRRARVQR